MTTQPIATTGIEAARASVRAYLNTATTLTLTLVQGATA